MKKIGIITLFYKKYNYGGILKSYALCKLLFSNNLHFKQIRYKKSDAKKRTLSYYKNTYKLNNLIKNYKPNFDKYNIEKRKSIKFLLSAIE